MPTIRQRRDLQPGWTAFGRDLRSDLGPGVLLIRRVNGHHGDAPVMRHDAQGPVQQQQIRPRRPEPPLIQPPQGVGIGPPVQRRNRPCPLHSAADDQVGPGPSRRRAARPQQRIAQPDPRRRIVPLQPPGHGPGVGAIAGQGRGSQTQLGRCVGAGGDPRRQIAQRARHGRQHRAVPAIRVQHPQPRKPLQQTTRGGGAVVRPPAVSHGVADQSRKSVAHVRHDATISHVMTRDQYLRFSATHIHA